MSIEEEARKLADYAVDSLRDAYRSFDVEPQFYGQEAKIIEGAENILRSEQVIGIKFSIVEEGLIGIQD